MFSSRPENALRDRIDQIGTASHVSGWKGIRSARGPKRPRWDLFLSDSEKVEQRENPRTAALIKPFQAGKCYARGQSKTAAGHQCGEL